VTSFNRPWNIGGGEDESIIYAPARKSEAAAGYLSFD
jgi:hypothetical protein